MAKMRIKPAKDDPKNSVDLFDTDRRNEWGEIYCVAPCILYFQVAERWQEYLSEINKEE